MILLNAKLNENFDKENPNMIAETECVKVFSEEYVEVFSPTVFETVEVYTSSSSSDQSENQDFSSDIAFLESSECNSMEASNELIDSMDTVSSLENLEPGTYTLDVLESNDFDFDTVFVNSNFNQEEPKKSKQGLDSSFEQNYGTENKEKKLKTFEETCKRYKLRNTYKNSVRKPLATKYSMKNVTAREFLNNFSDDLRKLEKSYGKKDETEEGRSLSWLLDFKISSIFHPVDEKEAEIAEKTKKNSNDIQKKPRYTYTELIEQALKENGELTVSGIYNWISNHYPYYQQHDDRWKNSVRHNLSINPQFRKGKKASQGAGHFWNISETISQNSERISNHIVNKDVAKPLSNPTCGLINQIDEEVLAATKSIQESENMDFTDVSLHDAAEQIHLDGKHMESSFVNITRNDIEQLWESTNEGDSRFSSFSPLIREISEESSNAIEEENFLIQDIHNSICLGDELFTNGLNSPYYGLTTI